MKKARCNVLYFLLLSIVFTACGGGGGGGGQQQAPSTPQSYTVMVYMIGSNLESQSNLGSANIAEMLAASSADNVNVLLTTGGANKTNWTTIQRHIIKHNSGMTVADLGNLDMANPATLQDFITWGQTNYPADHHILILWDHGSGIFGFGNDENHGMSTMSLNDLHQALQNANTATGRTFDVIGFDACLMGSAEVAYNIAPYGKYLVASENVIPGHGWDYTAILNAIVNNRTIDGTTLGRAICDSYKAKANTAGATIRAAGQAYNQDQTITLSVVDLSKITTVANALSDLGLVGFNDMIASGVTAWGPIARGRSNTEEYGNSKASKQFLDMVDIKNFATNLQATYPAQSTTLINAVTQAVLYKVSGTQQPNANGLSVYMPFHIVGSDSLWPQMQTYDQLNFPLHYRWLATQYTATGHTDITGPTFNNMTTIGQDTIQATMSDTDVQQVYMMITQTNPVGNQIFILGLDLADNVVGSTVEYQFTTWWPTLNGHFVSPFVMASENYVYLIDIPVLLNGDMVDLYALYDSQTGNFLILGAWPGASNGLAEKNLLPIKSTDVITPQFLTIDISTGIYFFTSGTPFTVGSTPALGFTELPDGTYDLFFMGIDYAQNTGLSAQQSFIVSPIQGAPSRLAAPQTTNSPINILHPVGNDAAISAGKVLDMIRKR